MSTPETPVPAVRDAQLDRFARLGQWLAASEVNGKPTREAEMGAAMRLYYADALGLPPMAAAELSIIKGRLFVQSKLLRALAARAGYRVVRDPGSDEKACTAILLRADTSEIVGSYSFTMEDARRAKIVREGSAWQTHPARMLWARASKFVLDDFAPEVTLGLLSEEEGEEIDAPEAGASAGPFDSGPPGPHPGGPKPGANLEQESAPGVLQVEDAEWTPAQEGDAPAGPIAAGEPPPARAVPKEALT